MIRALIVPLLALAPALCVSPANADTQWGAIAYTQDGKTFRFINYGSTDQLLSEAKTKWDPKADLIVIESGECAAVASYHDPLGGSRIVAGKGRSLEEATRNAVAPSQDRPDQASEHPDLLNTYCQQ